MAPDKVALTLQRVLRAGLASQELQEKFSEELLSRLLKQAHSHKVVPLIRDSLIGQLSSNQIEATDGLIARQRDWVGRVMNALTEQCVVIKGPSLAALYPNPSLRYFADVDIFVPDLATLRSISPRLEALGLRAAQSVHLRREPFSEALAQFSLRYQQEERRPGFAGVECHALSYPVTWSWGMDAAWFAERSTNGGGAPAALDSKSLACVVLADMQLSKRQKLRDLVDAHFLFKRLTHDEVGDVASFAMLHGLESCVATLHDRFDQAPIVSRPHQLALLHQLVRAGIRPNSSRHRCMWTQNILLALRHFSTQGERRPSLAGKAASALLRTEGMKSLWGAAGLVQEVPFQPGLLDLSRGNSRWGS